MRIVALFVVNICVAWPVLVAAQDTVEVEKIADTMVRLCVGGGRTEATSGTATGGADVSLRSLDIKGNVTGEFKINRSRAEGLVNGLDNAISQVAADQADKVRACLQPVRDRLLDVLLPKKRAEADVEISDVAVEYDDRKIAVLDVKMRNTGDSVATINSLGLQLEGRTRFVDCNNPSYSLMPVSAEYDLDIEKGLEKKIAHQIEANGTERIKLRVISSSAGALFYGVKARVEAKYNKANLVALSETVSFRVHGLTEILGMFTPGVSREAWERCAEDNRKRFCAVGISLYRDDPIDVCAKYN